MATEHWDDDRLDRLANQVEETANIANSNARVIQALANTAAEAREERQQILQLIAQQQVTIAQQQERMIQIEERIDRQQTNIDGLRRETMRMLDILLNQRNQQDNSGE
ncbi:hypothetical protein PN499_14235 [Kamptonema animale CS-326]|jgi:methyl-accepting chemotaxis protein|uniref:hypothetical protein n=1 Tax=Kamptonema animale TaxID=92934 RepID=UPI00232B3CC4|nr:hypothetical protein [Kamptonema animale]MDB9512347.1 hypothetical protein [Kamptonema animale CS-326]